MVRIFRTKYCGIGRKLAEEVVARRFGDFELEIGLFEEATEIGNGDGEAKTGFALEGDIDKMRILELGFEVKMVFEILSLPKVPDSNKDFAIGFEVAFNLIKNKELVFCCG